MRGELQIVAWEVANGCVSRFVLSQTTMKEGALPMTMRPLLCSKQTECCYLVEITRYLVVFQKLAGLRILRNATLESSCSSITIS